MNKIEETNEKIIKLQNENIVALKEIVKAKDLIIKELKEQCHIADVSKRYYLVRYCGGSYDDYYSAVVFVTNKKSTATKYCSKFNKALKKWESYYEQFETDNFGIKWIADEHIEKHFHRWNSLRNITECYYEEVSFR